jgi:MscS family membrane protein
MIQLLLNIDMTFFDREFMGEKLLNYIWFAAIIIVTIIIKKPIAVLITRLSSRLADRYSYIKHKDTIGPMLLKPLERLLQVILYFIATEQIAGLIDGISIHNFGRRKTRVAVNLGDIFDHIFLFLFIIFLTQVITRFIDFLYYLRMNKAQAEKNQSKIQLLPLIKEVSKLIAWILSTFWILGSVFRVNIPALITGLGIGGVAIALAGKETVENFFASFTILSDKPFQTGDSIKLGDTEGVVERIGFRSTRLRNADGSATIIPNQNLVSQNVINLSFRDTRGMKIVVNIKYGITHEALEALIVTIKKMLTDTPPVKEPIEVVVETMDKETFQMVISYHLPHPLPDDLKLLAVKRAINLKVFEVISKVATIGTPVGTS